MRASRTSIAGGGESAAGIVSGGKNLGDLIGRFFFSTRRRGVFGKSLLPSRVQHIGNIKRE